MSWTQGKTTLFGNPAKAFADVRYGGQINRRPGAPERVGARRSIERRQDRWRPDGVGQGASIFRSEGGGCRSERRLNATEGVGNNLNPGWGIFKKPRQSQISSATVKVVAGKLSWLAGKAIL